MERGAFYQVMDHEVPPYLWGSDIAAFAGTSSRFRNASMQQHNPRQPNVKKCLLKPWPLAPDEFKKGCTHLFENIRALFSSILVAATVFNQEAEREREDIYSCIYSITFDIQKGLTAMAPSVFVEPSAAGRSNLNLGWQVFAWVSSENQFQQNYPRRERLTDIDKCINNHWMGQLVQMEDSRKTGWFKQAAIDDGVMWVITATCWRQPNVCMDYMDRQIKIALTNAGTMAQKYDVIKEEEEAYCKYLFFHHSYHPLP